MTWLGVRANQLCRIDNVSMIWLGVWVINCRISKDIMNWLGLRDDCPLPAFFANIVM